MNKPYRLQRLLDLRETQLDERKAALSAASHKLMAAEKAEEVLQGSIAQLSQCWSEQAPGGISGWTAGDFERAVRRGTEMLHEAQVETVQARTILNGCRRDYETALTNAKALEKARERAHFRFAREEQRLEQCELDEHAVLMEARASA